MPARPFSPSPLSQHTSDIDINPEARDAMLYRDAAIYLHEGCHHSPFAYHPQTERAKKLYMFTTTMRYQLVQIVVALIYLSVIFFEHPAGPCVAAALSC